MAENDKLRSERDKIFATISEIVEMNMTDVQIAIQKIMKAIAANGSFTLQFLNMMFTELKSIRSDLDKNDTGSAKAGLDRLIGEITEFRKRI